VPFSNGIFCNAHAPSTMNEKRGQLCGLGLCVRSHHHLGCLVGVGLVADSTSTIVQLPTADAVLPRAVRNHCERAYLVLPRALINY